MGYSPWGCKQSDRTERLSTGGKLFERPGAPYLLAASRCFPYPQGYYEVSVPLLLASGPLAWGGWVAVKLMFLPSGFQTTLLILEDFLACSATLEPLLYDPQSLMKGGGSWLPA